MKRESDVSAEIVDEGLPLTTAIPGWRREMSDARGPVPVYYQDGMPVFAHGNYLRGEPPDLDHETNEKLSKSSESKRSFRLILLIHINEALQNSQGIFFQSDFTGFAKTISIFIQGASQ